MKLSEILKRLDKSDKNKDNSFCLEKLASECGIDSYIPWSADCKIECYWIANHYCTDTFVGYRAYFIGDQLICCSYQSARKSPEDFYFLNKESWNTLKNYILSLLEDDNEIEPEYLNLEEDIGEFYPIQYAGQFIKRKVLYKGEPAFIIKELQYEFKEPSVLIKLKQEEIWVFPSEIQTPFNIL